MVNILKKANNLIIPHKKKPPCSRAAPYRINRSAPYSDSKSFPVSESGTNDIDVNTLRALEEGLEDFAGCAVVISHDRWFLDRICTHILAFEGDSNVFFFEGSYSEYEENKLKRLGKEEPTRVRYRKLMND